MAEPIGYVMQRVEIYELSPEQQALKDHLAELQQLAEAGHAALQKANDLRHRCDHAVKRVSSSPGFGENAEVCVICGSFISFGT